MITRPTTSEAMAELGSIGGKRNAKIAGSKGMRDRIKKYWNSPAGLERRARALQNRKGRKEKSN